MAESNRVISRLLSFILLFDCQEAFHCCLVVACSNRINMISIQCHRVGEWSAGKPECGNCIVPVWGNHDYAGLNEVAIPFKFPIKSGPNNRWGEEWPMSQRRRVPITKMCISERLSETQDGGTCYSWESLLSSRLVRSFA